MRTDNRLRQKVMFPTETVELGEALLRNDARDAIRPCSLIKYTITCSGPSIGWITVSFVCVLVCTGFQFFARTVNYSMESASKRVETVKGQLHRGAKLVGR